MVVMAFQCTQSISIKISNQIFNKIESFFSFALKSFRYSTPILSNSMSIKLFVICQIRMSKPKNKQTSEWTIERTNDERFSTQNSIFNAKTLYCTSERTKYAISEQKQPASHLVRQPNYQSVSHLVSQSFNRSVKALLITTCEKPLPPSPSLPLQRQRQQQRNDHHRF